jgi:AraC family transcriptional regulator of adaptative response/methylated-DNA-[protein]-cysteine methyltransferase
MTNEALETEARSPVGVNRGQIARAVAKACASNAVAILIPCHRVIMSNGAMGGYRWGGARKRALLQLEAGPGRS